MAKPIGQNVITPFVLPKGLEQHPGNAPQDLTFWAQPKGMDKLSPLMRVDRDHSPLLSNLFLYKGVLRSRNAIKQIGSKPAGPSEPTFLASDIEGLSTFGASGTRYSLRWTASRLWRFTAGDWADTGVANHLLTTVNNVDFTTWRFGGESLRIVYSTSQLAAVPGLVEYDLFANTNRILAGSPTGRHVATFGNRIVVSSTTELFNYHPSRVQWCVKNDDNDWIGLGSGAEDLMVATNDTYDEVMGVFPISDTTALVIRETSIWRMDVTGFFDAPFKFTLLTDQLGTTARRTIRTVPAGVVFLGYDDVYVVTLQGIQRIGLPGIAHVFTDPTFSALGSAGVASTLIPSWGYYDHFNKRYWLNVKNLGLYCYSFDDQGWTKIATSFEPWSVAQTYYQSGSQEFHGVYVTPDFASGAFTMREDPAATNDDDPQGSTNIATTFEAWTGIALVGSSLHQTDLNEMQLEYEADANQTLFFDYYRNGAWTQFGTLAIVATSGPSVVSVRKAITGTNLQVRIRSDTLGKIKIYALHVFATQGALIRA